MSNPNLVMERVKWALLLVFSLIFLLWIMFGTRSSGGTVAQTDSTEQQQAEEERQFQSQLNAADTAEDPTSDTGTEETNETISDYQVFLNIDGEWGDAEISEATGIKDYVFAHNDGSELRVSISLNELNAISADYAWEHTAAAADDGYNIDFVVESGSNTVLCEEGSSGCSAGNGILDITSVNQSETSSDSPVFVRVVVKDLEQDISEAESYYKGIIESIQVKKQEA